MWCAHSLWIGFAHVDYINHKIIFVGFDLLGKNFKLGSQRVASSTFWMIDENEVILVKSFLAMNKINSSLAVDSIDW